MLKDESFLKTPGSWIETEHAETFDSIPAFELSRFLTKKGCQVEAAPISPPKRLQTIPADSKITNPDIEKKESIEEKVELERLTGSRPSAIIAETKHRSAAAAEGAAQSPISLNEEAPDSETSLHSTEPCGAFNGRERGRTPHQVGESLADLKIAGKPRSPSPLQNSNSPWPPQAIRKASFFADESDPVHLPPSRESSRDPNTRTASVGAGARPSIDWGTVSINSLPSVLDERDSSPAPSSHESASQVGFGRRLSTSSDFPGNNAGPLSISWHEQQIIADHYRQLGSHSNAASHRVRNGSHSHFSSSQQLSSSGSNSNLFSPQSPSAASLGKSASSSRVPPVKGTKSPSGGESQPEKSRMNGDKTPEAGNGAANGDARGVSGGDRNGQGLPGRESSAMKGEGRSNSPSGKRSLSVNAVPFSRSSPGPPRSPSATQSMSQQQHREQSQADGGGPAVDSPRLSQALATMHEDVSHDFSQRGTSGNEPPGLRHPQFRHRSTSSAAALALHLPESDRGGPRLSHGFNAPSRSIWGHENSPIHLGFPIQDRGFNARYGFASAGVPGYSRYEEDESALLSSSETDTSSFSASGPRRGGSGIIAPPTSFDPSIGYSNVSPMVGGGMGGFHLSSEGGQGTDSRRHSIAGGPAPIGVASGGGQRRAIGFEVNRGAGSSVSRNISEGPVNRVAMTGGSSRGFGPFAGGSLAFSEDDLAGDIDFKPLQRELDRAKEEQEKEQMSQQQSYGHQMSIRVPSVTAAVTGAHAASMPPVFGDRGFDAFGSSPITRQGMGTSRHAGLDSLSASWDILTPTTPSRGEVPTRETFVEMARQLREVDMAGELSRGYGSSYDSHRHRYSLSRDIDEDEHAAGTATVKASPGGSPIRLKSNASFALSPRAQAFSLGGIGTISSGTAFDPQQQMASTAASLAQQQANSAPLYAGTHQRQTSTGALGLQSMAAGGQQPGATGSMMLGQQQVNRTGFPQFMTPGPSLPAPPQLSDFAFAGLSTLGPMPPSAGGMGSGMGSATSGQPADLQELGKGVPLSSLPKDTPLYIVEFKQGRTDLFFRYQAPGVSKQALDREPIQKGDLVIVEADRGKDLGTVANDNINVEQVQSFLAHQSELAIITAGGKPEEATSSTGDSPTTETSSGAMSSSPTSASGTTTKPSRSINPKRLFSKATAADTSLLYSKAQDEERALQLCITKVNQRGLPMTVVAAEMQWDRRKLTFYYTASMRVDFRDLVKELFRLYKTRIWMCHLGHPSGTGMG